MGFLLLLAAVIVLIAAFSIVSYTTGNHLLQLDIPQVDLLSILCRLGIQRKFPVSDTARWGRFIEADGEQISEPLALFSVFRGISLRANPKPITRSVPQCWVGLS